LYLFFIQSRRGIVIDTFFSLKSRALSFEVLMLRRRIYAGIDDVFFFLSLAENSLTHLEALFGAMHWSPNHYLACAARLEHTQGLWHYTKCTRPQALAFIGTDALGGAAALLFNRILIRPLACSSFHT
jgi:hypothetical protein